MLEELRRRALEKRDEICSDPNMDEEERETADMVVEFLSKEEGFNQVAKSTILQMFVYLDYEIDFDRYEKMYDEVMREVNQTYIYVNPEDLAER